MAVAVYVPSRIGGGDFTDLPIPLVGDNGKAVTYDHGTGAFVYTPFEVAGAVATHVGLADPHTQYELETNNTASAILTKLLTVDGAGSGLDADLLDGNSSAAFLLATGATTGATSQAQTFTNGIVGPTWKPASDSATAIQVQNAAGTAVVTVDTTSPALRINAGYLLLGVTAFDDRFYVYGDITNTANAIRRSYYSQLRVDTTTVAITSEQNGSYGKVYFINGENTATRLVAVTGEIQSAASGILTEGKAFATRLTNTGTGTIGSLYGMHIQAAANSGGGTITTIYGLRIENQSVGGTNYAIYTNGGLVRFGDQVRLVAGTTSAASLNVAAGAAPTSPNAGDIWYLTGGRLQVYRAATETIASGVTGSAFTQTYSTAARTVNAYTTDAEAAYTGQDNAQVGSVYAKYADLEALRVAYTNLEASHLNLLQVVTAVVDDLQSFAISG